MLFITCLTSSVVKLLSSSVSVGSSIDFLICLWYSVSSDWSSLGIRYSSVHCSVSRRPPVCDPSAFCRVVIIWLLPTFPAADLYTMFHGFVDSVLLQYCFQDCILAFFYSCLVLSFFCLIFHFSLFPYIVIVFCSVVFPSECNYPLLCYC